MLTRYPPSSRFVTEELGTPDSFLTGIVKFLVTSFHLNHEKVKGPVPPGLTAVSAPFCVPEALQKIKTGCLNAGAEGYDEYLIALLPGAVSCAFKALVSNIATINK